VKSALPVLKRHLGEPRRRCKDSLVRLFVELRFISCVLCCVDDAYDILTEMWKETVVAYVNICLQVKPRKPVAR
jgi:hypothetical protein